MKNLRLAPLGVGFCFFEKYAFNGNIAINDAYGKKVLIAITFIK
jgi:hypothetical protein